MANIEVQSEVRKVIDWIVNDVRQTVRTDIASNVNDPSSTHIKFKKVIDFNPAAGEPEFGNFVEYTYDPDAETMTRTETGNNNVPPFENISGAVFRTRLADGAEIDIDPINPGNDSPMLTTGNLIVEITVRKPVEEMKVLGEELYVAHTLIEEVQIRNQ
jgi:hypothetical protein